MEPTTWRWHSRKRSPVSGIAVTGTNNLEDRDTLQITRQVIEQARVVRKLLIDLPNRINNALRFVIGQQPQQARHVLPVDSAEH